MAEAKEKSNAHIPFNDDQAKGDIERKIKAAMTWASSVEVKFQELYDSYRVEVKAIKENILVHEGVKFDMIAETRLTYTPESYVKKNSSWYQGDTSITIPEPFRNGWAPGVQINREINEFLSTKSGYVGSAGNEIRQGDPSSAYKMYRHSVSPAGGIRENADVMVLVESFAKMTKGVAGIIKGWQS
jgi:hypothetical protein